jgi:outer membrane protein assembly factor BamB
MRMLRPVLILATLALLIAASPWCPCGAAADWTGWRGTNRDGKSGDTGLLKQWPDTGPKLLWKTDTVGEGYGSMAVSGGTVYTSGTVDGKLKILTFDLDGKPGWQAELDVASKKDPGGSRATPTIDQGSLYLLSGNGVLGCFDARSGDRKWTRSAKEFGGESGGWGYAESVLIYKDLAVFKPGGKNCIAALDKATGQTVWTSTSFSAGPEYGSCLLVEFNNRPLIVTGTNAGIFCVDARDGKLLWKNNFSARNTANCPTPAYADGYVFWANGYGKGGICLKLKTDGDAVAADVAWTTRDMDCHHGGYVIHEGYIYGNNGGGWACLELATGKKAWNERAVGKGSLCFADGMLYLFSENGGAGGLATCSPEGLEMKGKVKVDGSGTSWAHPVVSGGRLYLRYDKNLYCFQVSRPNQ